MYFSLRAQECPDTCPNASSESCSSRMKQFNYKNGFYIDYDDSAVEGNRFKISLKSSRAVSVFNLLELGHGFGRTQGIENYMKPIRWFIFRVERGRRYSIGRWGFRICLSFSMARKRCCIQIYFTKARS